MWKQCAACGTNNPPEFSFCQRCGQPLQQSAPSTSGYSPTPPLGYTAPSQQYGQPVQQPPPLIVHNSSNSHTGVIVAVAVVVTVIIVVLVIALLALSGGGGGGVGGGGSSPTAHTIVSSGTVWQLNAGNYEYIQFTLPSSASMGGSFTATNGVTVYCFTPSEYQSFSSTGSASSYVWTSGSVSSGYVNFNLGSGTYYLVFQNTNLITTSSVQVTSDITATY